jgi:hypothetical protein
MTEDATQLSISLVSHTNVGKTTLARTLLARDIGEVRDEAHVTERAEPHALIESAAGDRLLLWDTPGFGDSLRLARRLAQAGNPLGWLLSEVWDRWRDRAFWSSQRAVRHVLDQADVALYLVNAAEAPEDAAYLAPELQVLGLLGKPVVVLLNQLGPPGDAADEARQLQRWQAHLATLQSAPGAARVHAVLPLDAFARCWVQEGVLLRAVADALPAARQPAMARLAEAWTQRQLGTWRAAMAVLAERLARAALDREPVSATGWRAPLQAVKTLAAVLGGGEGERAPDPAMAALATRLDAEVRRSTAVLIRLHGLRGEAGGQVLAFLARDFARRQPVSEGKAALWGGVVTGALAGLKADIASGGLTLGGGLLLGGVLGALGAAGAARGVNRIRGLHQPLLVWDDQVLDTLLNSALLAYLAVAHHGRGRGDWQASAPPPAWGEVVARVLDERREVIATLWQRRQDRLAAPVSPVDGEALQAALQALLLEASAAVLGRLYPEACATVRWPAEVGAEARAMAWQVNGGDDPEKP